MIWSFRSPTLQNLYLRFANLRVVLVDYVDVVSGWRGWEQPRALKGLGIGSGLPAAHPSLLLLLFLLGVMTWGNDEFPTYYKLLARWLVR